MEAVEGELGETGGAAMRRRGPSREAEQAERAELDRRLDRLELGLAGLTAQIAGYTEEARSLERSLGLTWTDQESDSDQEQQAEEPASPWDPSCLHTEPPPPPSQTPPEPSPEASLPDLDHLVSSIISKEEEEIDSSRKQLARMLSGK